MSQVGELMTSSNAFSGFSHLRAPGGAAADYVSTSSSLPLARPFQKLILTSANENVTSSVVSLQSCNIILCDFSHTLLVLREYWDSHQSYICLQIRAGICAVPMADAMANGKVNCCNFIGHSRGVWRHQPGVQ